jgi:hypothetical protein
MGICNAGHDAKLYIYLKDEDSNMGHAQRDRDIGTCVPTAIFEHIIQKVDLIPTQSDTLINHACTHFAPEYLSVGKAVTNTQ